MTVSNQDLLSFSKDLPIIIRTYNYDFPSLHRHSAIELLFVLTGTATIITEGKSWDVGTEDVFLINENSEHEIIPNNCAILSISFRPKDLKHPSVSDNFFFNLNSTGETTNKRYDYVRHLMARLVKVNASGENTYMTLSLVFALISHLYENFLGVASSDSSSSSRYRNRITDILSYIDEHYHESITLTDIADELNLSVPYLSSFFKKNMRKTFSDYYNDLRLSHTVSDMLLSDDTLETIAMNNGFPDSRSLVTQFKKKYDCTPSAYRRRHEAIFTPGQNNTSSQIIEDDFKSLAKYLTLNKQNDANHTSANESQMLIDAGTVDLATQGEPLKHNFRNVCCVGSARQLLYQEVREMVQVAQNTLQYQYVKFHGILSDEMMIYTENEQSHPIYSFTLIDKVLDFLLSINLKPLVQLSFMPFALASDPSKMVDMRNFNTSPPKDINKWTRLVEAVVKHMIQRYGTAEVHSWLFCVWNEPDTSIDSFGWDVPEEFYNFYKETYRTVKSISAKLMFGTPSLLLRPNTYQKWTKGYFDYCTLNDCTADFLNIHYYDNSFVHEDYDQEFFSLSNLEKNCPLSEDPFAFTKYINQIYDLTKTLKISHLPIYLTEWNLTVSHRDLINDTCFKSCYLTKNLLENYDRLNSFGYWCMTDFIEEMQLSNELYHGGLGMFTHNGIPKSHYNTFCMLTHLGDILLKKGNGFYITRDENRIVIIVYNYEHYSKLFASGILFDMTSENRYAPFAQMSKAKFTAQLNHIPSTGCLVKETFVNQNYGSSYDAWTRMGSPQLTDQQDLEHLRQQSRPGIYIHREKIKNKMLQLSVELDPLEVRLIEIELD